MAKKVIKKKKKTGDDLEDSKDFPRLFNEVMPKIIKRYIKKNPSGRITE